MKTAIQEAEEAHIKFNRRESLQKEIKDKLDGNKQGRASDAGIPYGRWYNLHTKFGQTYE